MATQTTFEVGGMGHSIKRKEDPRFIRGKGNYVDDIQLPGMLHMDIVRSPFAHAKIVKINSEKALKVPGVLAVITGETLKQFNLHWMPTLMSDTQMVLPVEKVMYQSQEVAAVIATDRYTAADGVEAVEVEYDPLPGVGDPFKALEPGAPVLRTDKEGKKDNRIFHWEAGDRAGTDKAFAEADVVVKQNMYIPRIHVASIETCGCVADFDRVRGKLTVYMTTQAPHAIRTVFALVAGHVGLSEEKSPIVSPDIGGGFGGKVPVYPGYVIAVAASVVIGKPVKWVGDRQEDLQGGLLARAASGVVRKAGQVGGRPDGEPPGRFVRARLPHRGGAGGEEGRDHDGAPDQDDRRPRVHRRRGQPVEVPRGALLDLHGLVRIPEGLRGGGRRVHEQAAGRYRLPLLVPRDGGGAHDRADGRHPGAGAQDGSGRPAIEELHTARQVPLPLGARLGLRQRQLPGRPDEGDGQDRLCGSPPGAGRETQARRADGDRNLELRRDRGRRAVEALRHPGNQDVRFVRAAGPPDRQGDRAVRDEIPGAGPRDDVRPDHRRGARDSRGPRGSGRGGHRHGAVRPRDLCQPLDPGGGRCRGHGRAQSPRKGEEDRGPPARGQRG